MSGSRLRGAATSVAALALLGGGLTACGGGTPAVCSDLSDVQSTLRQLQNVQPGANTLSELKKWASTLNKQLHQLAADASNQYSSQIQAVQQSLQALQTDVRAASSHPTAASIGQLQPDLADVRSSMHKLSSAVSTTC